ncbi:MAG TPA: site-specific integrase [Candidatus Saccharimonadales bacterium]|nr:site-specific integrase [Candidatus Saccharimonadales bacterium]
MTPANTRDADQQSTGDPDIAQGPLQAVRDRFPARRPPISWLATCQPRKELLARLSAAPFVLEVHRSQARRATGLRLALDWLGDQAGDTWQERWSASGVEDAGASWREVPARWLEAAGDQSPWRHGALVESVPVLIAAEAIRPSLSWLAVGGAGRGSGLFVRTMTALRDPDGFAALGAACDADPGVSVAARGLVLYRAAQIMAAKGGGLRELVVGDVAELVEEIVATHDSITNLGGVLLYRLLHEMGILGPAAPPTLRALRTRGQRTVSELVDGYGILCRPVRDVLVDYLAERQPSLDYVSLKNLAYCLAKLFWSDLERHHPGIDSLRLSREAAERWKRRLRTVTKTITSQSGERVEVSVERTSYQSCLVPVRAFYLDIASWAAEDPDRWGGFVAPCPVSQADVNQKKYVRQRKSRMDARTRERLPVLPVLVAHLAERHQAAVALLGAAREAAPGAAFTAAGTSLVRRVVRHPTPGTLRAADPASGRRRELVLEEDHAFWAFAIVEVLRATGVRIEELLELDHHSVVQYRLPSTGEVLPLLQIAPSKTDTERLLVVTPELAEVLSAIIVRVADGTGLVPLVPAYDHHEKLWSQPRSLLFQRRVKDENRAISYSVVRKLLDTALASSGLVDVDGAPLLWTPHDFRRIMITDAIMNGLPPHIAQVIAGHGKLTTTMGYKAVYPDEAIQSHLAFLARRRALRPSEEYRTPTDEEWQEFLGHFERRKVSIGTCARAFSTPCSHEHACVRCSMLWPDPEQAPRLTEIRDNLTARIDEAEREGWLGEIDGLEISLAGANKKLSQMEHRRNLPVAVHFTAPPTRATTSNPPLVKVGS